MQWLLVTLLAFDLASIKTEANLQKRSELALDNANSALDQAREAYQAGDVSKMELELKEVGESVEMAYRSLEDTGKDARRNPKFFKRAELRTRELLRRLEGVRDAVGYEQRSLVESLRERVDAVHDDLLQGLMMKKK